MADAGDPAMVNEFRSDREAGKRPFSREKAFPELQDGMSTFGTLEAARAQWDRIQQAAGRRGQKVELGDYIAAVRLQPDCGFSLEDLSEPDQHLTIWGDPATLAAAVCRTYPALTEGK
jgi:hypothetical protein